MEAYSSMLSSSSRMYCSFGILCFLDDFGTFLRFCWSIKYYRSLCKNDFNLFNLRLLTLTKTSATFFKDFYFVSKVIGKFLNIGHAKIQFLWFLRCFSLISKYGSRLSIGIYSFAKIEWDAFSIERPSKIHLKSGYLY